MADLETLSMPLLWVLCKAHLPTLLPAPSLIVKGIDANSTSLNSLKLIFMGKIVMEKVCKSLYCFKSYARLLITKEAFSLVCVVIWTLSKNQRIRVDYFPLL
jgi:hypothetical protein